MKKNYDQLASHIVKNVGGKENISFFTHCVTRLRFNIIDKSDVNEEELKKLSGVIGVQWTGEQFQVIVGQEVADIYHVICQQTGLKEEASIDENLDSDKKKMTIKSFFGGMLDTVSSIMASIIPAIVGAGLLTGVSVLLLTLQVLTQDSPIYLALTIAASGAQYYLPMLVAYSAAKKFKCNPVMAIAITGMLLSPSFVSMVSSGVEFSVFGIPTKMVDYANQIIPVILIVWAYSYVEKYLNKIMPKMFSFILTPLLSLLVMLPLALCVFGPLGSYIGDILKNVLVGVYNAIGPVGTGLIGALFIPLVSTGMHTAMNQIGGISYATTGVDYMYFPAVYTSCYALMGVCLGFAIKSKGEKKNVGYSSFISQAVASISEPGIFGILYGNKKLFAVQIIGGFVGGVICGLAHVGWFLPTPANIVFGVLSFSGGEGSNFIYGVIACLAAFVVSFVLSLVITKREENA